MMLGTTNIKYCNYMVLLFVPLSPLWLITILYLKLGSAASFHTI